MKVLFVTPRPFTFYEYVNIYETEANVLLNKSGRIMDIITIFYLSELRCDLRQAFFSYRSSLVLVKLLQKSTAVP
jgi:hypothetical protein